MTRSESEQRGEHAPDDTVLDFVVDDRHEAFHARLVHDRRGEFGNPLESYLQSEMRIKVGIRLRVPEVEPRYWVAVFQRVQVEATLGRGMFVRRTPPHSAGSKADSASEQEPVFVGVDEPVEHVEHGAFGISWLSRLPCELVRLYGFDRVDDLLTGDLRYASRAWSTRLRCGREADGELCVLVGDGTVEYHELPREMVQRGPHIRQEVAQDETPLGLHRGDSLNLVDVLRWVTVKLSDEALTVGVQGIGKSVVEIASMETGPVEFGPHTVQWRAHDAQSSAILRGWLGPGAD